MNFLGMGPGELMVIMVLALIVFGPQKLPEISRNVGKAVGEFRRATTSITEEINRELSLETPPPAREKSPASPASQASATENATEAAAAPLMLEIKPSARVAADAPTADGVDMSAPSDDIAVESLAADDPAADLPLEAAPVESAVETSVVGAPEKPVEPSPVATPADVLADQEPSVAKPEATP